MTKIILHISHTDITKDSRILKEMDALTKLKPEFSIYGLGVVMAGGNAPSSHISDFNIQSIRIFTRNLTVLPKVIRHFFLVIELFLKFTIISLKLKPDIVHCHDVVILPVGFVLKKIRKSKLVYDAHELESHKNGTTPLLSKLTYAVEKMIMPSADLLITVSPGIQDWYNKNLKPRRSEVILNAPLPSPLPPLDKNYLRNLFNIPQNSKIFIYVGVLAKGRGLELITNFFSSNTENHLVFLGYGKLLENIHEYSKQYHNIHLHEAVPHEKVVEAIRSADVGLCLIENVSLSDYLCLPNKLFEYCFAGLPVVASRFPELEKIITEYKLGICCELEEQSIASALEKILEVQNIDTQKIEQFSWKAQANKLIKAYKSLC